MHANSSSAASFANFDPTIPEKPKTTAGQVYCNSLKYYNRIASMYNHVPDE